MVDALIMKELGDEQDGRMEAWVLGGAGAWVPGGWGVEGSFIMIHVPGSPEAEAHGLRLRRPVGWGLEIHRILSARPRPMTARGWKPSG
jgi:hypothetical protein